MIGYKSQSLNTHANVMRAYAGQLVSGKGERRVGIARLVCNRGVKVLELVEVLPANLQRSSFDQIVEQVGYSIRAAMPDDSYSIVHSAIGNEWIAVLVTEHQIGGIDGGDDHTQGRDGLRPERHDMLGTRLATKFIDDARFKIDFRPRQFRQLGLAEPAIDRQQDHCEQLNAGSEVTRACGNDLGRCEPKQVANLMDIIELPCHSHRLTTLQAANQIATDVEPAAPPNIFRVSQHGNEVADGTAGVVVTIPTADRIVNLLDQIAVDVADEIASRDGRDAFEVTPHMGERFGQELPALHIGLPLHQVAVDESGNGGVIFRGLRDGQRITPPFDHLSMIDFDGFFRIDLAAYPSGSAVDLLDVTFGYDRQRESFWQAWRPFHSVFRLGAAVRPRDIASDKVEISLKKRKTFGSCYTVFPAVGATCLITIQTLAFAMLNAFAIAVRSTLKTCKFPEISICGGYARLRLPLTPERP